MPYIARERRPLYDDAIAALAAKLDAGTPDGDMNYILTRLLVRWIQERGLNYSAIADAVGVLETAKLELYRRVAAPYEDRKIDENGDAYEELADGSAPR